MMQLSEHLNNYRRDEEGLTEEVRPCAMEIVGDAKSGRTVLIDFSLPAQLGKITTTLQGKLTLPLACPNEACGSLHIWKDGYDYQTKSPQQLFQCAKDERKFYVHTSRYFKALATDLTTDLLQALLDEGLPLKAIADRYHLSETRLSQVGQEFRQYLFEQCQTLRGLDPAGTGERYPPQYALRANPTQYVGVLRQRGPITELVGYCRQEYLVPFEADQTGLMVVDVVFYAVIRNQPHEPRPHYGQIAVMDETFLVIGGLRYYLIAVVDLQGTILSWGLSRTRAVDDLTAVFLEALAVIPFPGIVISDGLANYSAMLKQFPTPVIHIQHIHSRPYGRIILSQRFFYWKEIPNPDSKPQGLTKELWSQEIHLETTTQVLNQPGLKQGYLLVKAHQHTQVKKKRGRPKGSTNRKEKDLAQAPTQAPKEPEEKKKRGRKKATQDGVPVDIHLTYDPTTLVHQLTLDAPLPEGVHVSVFFLLWTLCPHFLGISLGSNYVENLFSQFKRWFNVGRRTDLLRFLHKFEAFSLCHNDRTRGTSEFDRWIARFLDDHPPSATLGFRNIFAGKPPPLPRL